ncbi:unnamed protein product [Brassica rapa subsp. narinosa]
MMRSVTLVLVSTVNNRGTEKAKTVDKAMGLLVGFKVLRTLDPNRRRTKPTNDDGRNPPSTSPPSSPSEEGSKPTTIHKRTFFC